MLKRLYFVFFVSIFFSNNFISSNKLKKLKFFFKGNKKEKIELNKKKDIINDNLKNFKNNPGIFKLNISIDKNLDENNNKLDKVFGSKEIKSKNFKDLNLETNKNDVILDIKENENKKIDDLASVVNNLVDLVFISNDSKKIKKVEHLKKKIKIFLGAIATLTTIGTSIYFSSNKK